MSTATSNTTSTIQKERFGRFELVRVQREATELAIVPDFGGHLIAFNLHRNGQKLNLLDSYETPVTLEAHDYYKSAFLLPYPNRLRDGSYAVDGQSYQFPINNQETGNSIHGFKDFYNMQVAAISEDEQFSSVQLKSSYDGSNAAYPFTFDLELTYELGNRNDLTVQVKVTNTHHAPIPMGMGWHPYFQMGERVGNLDLELPAAVQVAIDDRMLPTGELLPHEDFTHFNTIEDRFLDNCFKLLNTSTPVTSFYLRNREMDLQVRFWQSTKQFPFFQAFTPPSRKSIAIEPMTCNIDAFNTGDGLMMLAAGDTFEGEFGFEVSKVTQ